MGDRKPGHEQWRDLFKGGSREQTNVRVAKSNDNGPAGGGGRSKPSTNSPNTASPFKPVKKGSAEKLGMSARSSKSVKKSKDRNKPSGKRGSGSRKKTSNNNQTPSDNSNRRTSGGSKERIRTPTTPPFAFPGSKARTPKQSKQRKPTPKKANTPGAESQCVTVFENAPGATPAGATIDGGQIQLAAARIKERKLQWKKEGLSPAKTDPAKTDPRQQTSSEPMSEGETVQIPSKEPIIPSKEPIKQANLTVRDRTIFDNEDGHPALVKEEKPKLQWAPGAVHESMSEPAVRKKKSDDKAARGAVSDRPPRDVPPMKPPRGLPALVVRTPPQTPIRGQLSPVCGTAHTPEARSPISAERSTSKHRAVRLDPTAWAIDQKTNQFSTTGSTDLDNAPSPADKPQSCYLAPNMQQAAFTPTDRKNTGQVDSEPYDIPDKK